MRYKLQVYFNNFSVLHLQCLVMFNVYCTCKILSAVDMLTLKNLNYENQPMYDWTMENVAYFLQNLGFSQPQATQPIMITQVRLNTLKKSGLFQFFFEKFDWFLLLFWWNCDLNYVKCFDYLGI